MNSDTLGNTREGEMEWGCRRPFGACETGGTLHDSRFSCFMCLKHNRVRHGARDAINNMITFGDPVASYLGKSPSSLYFIQGALEKCWVGNTFADGKRHFRY